MAGQPLLVLFAQTDRLLTLTWGIGAFGTSLGLLGWGENVGRHLMGPSGCCSVRLIAAKQVTGATSRRTQHSEEDEWGNYLGTGDDFNHPFLFRLHPIFLSEE